MSPHALGYSVLAVLAFADRSATHTQLAFGGAAALLAVVAMWAGDSRREDTDAAPRTLPVNRRRVDAGQPVDAEAGATGGTL